MRQDVESLPVSQAELSIALLRSGQCLDGVNYTTSDDVARFFIGIFSDALRIEMQSALQDSMPGLLSHLESGELTVRAVQYTQLKKCKLLDTDTHKHTPPTPNGTFQSFMAKKIRTTTQGKVRADENGFCVVMGPTGQIYEQQTKLQSKYSFVLECTAGVCTASFKYAGTRATVTLTQPVDPRIVTQTIASGKDWLDQIAHAGFWPFMNQQREQQEQSQDAQSSIGSSRSESSKYEFVQIDGSLYAVGKKDNRVQIANFYISQILAAYTSSITPPIFKVQVICDEGERVAMIELSQLRYAHDVLRAFQMVDAGLFTVDFSPSMLTAYLLSFPKPPKAKLITYWGVQNDGVVILGNRAFDTSTGDLMTIDETEWAFWDKTFLDDKVNAFKLEDFPRIVPMPIHLRYTVGYKLFNEICPEMFMNNFWAAITVLAWQIVAMFYPYMQKGEFGGSAGNPVLYMNGDHGTGKSSAAKMGAALTGQFGPLPSGQTTMPAMMRKASLSTFPTHYEDPRIGDEVGSWQARLPAIVRTFHDGSERMVCGKTDTPRSTFAISTNEPLPCADDTALWSRVIYVRFKKLTGEPPSSTLYSNFINACVLHSSLMPDYFTLVRSSNGFDVCAINDFITFLDEVTCTTRERNNSGWARVGYVMVLLTKLYQGTPEKLYEALEYVANNCHYQSTRMLSSPGLFERFLEIVLEIIARGQSVLYDSDQCVYFHCYRTTITIGNEPVLCVRLDWWARYLKAKNLLNATAQQIRDARPRDHTEMRSDVPFYDVQSSPWPPSYDGKPYTEVQMMEAALAKPKPCLVISETYITSFELNKCAAMRDINLVQITSTRADIGSYNFVHAICSGEWFGFDTFDSHKFAPFCHTNIAMMDKLDDEIVQLHAEEGLPRVEHCTSIGYMSNVFRVDGYNSDELLPCFEKAHFQFMHENEQPTKRQCILRMRGGARVRAPARAPGDNTLPSRTPAPIVAAPVVATLAPIQVTPTAQPGKENIDPNFQNLEDLIDNVDWDENGITMDDIDMANQFDDSSFWS
jgi:hypothetical protein